MDSPVILDSATKFGRNIDLDRGFPFDEEGFGRRTDIRSHLDDLAARHPEFADQLLNPPWADVDFPGTGSLRRNSRNRRNSNERPHNHSDEDARSQASGSSGASEPDNNSSSGEQKIPQYGLRNTVDIGQHQHSMENPQQQRNVRSMSAPPENRNNASDAGQPRFVSRVEITPQTGAANQTQAQTQQQQAQPQTQAQQPQATQREKSPAPKPAPQPQQQGNVRHIPIFVEGRDKPVIPKDIDEPDFARRQQSPPQFQRPSHYQQHFNRRPHGWDSPFQESFFEHPTNRWGHPTAAHQTHPPHAQARHNQQEKPRTQQTHHPESHEQSQRQKPQPQQQQQQPETPPKPKQQIQPKDPLERVAMVQKEVDALTEQVKQYTGNSRQDKQYMYLDEMLTRELIKLDDIETEGKENVRQARKQAIKSIQESISLLESKAPLPGQQEEAKEKSVKENKEPTENEEKPVESMETTSTEEPAPEEQNKAIPLPAPVPSSPTKTQAQENEPQQNEDVTVQNQESASNAESQVEVALNTSENSTTQEAPKIEENKETVQPMDSSGAVNNATSMEVSQPVQEVHSDSQHQQNESQTLIINEQNQEIKDAAVAPVPDTSAEVSVKEITAPSVEAALPATESSTEKPKKVPPPVLAKPGKSPKSPKKAKKTKKESVSVPVSEAAIPLPAPGQSI